MDWREHAVEFIDQLLRKDQDEMLPLQDILDAILAQQLRNLEQLREFLEDHEDHFFMENGQVALHDPELEADREAAVDFFRQALVDELANYNERPHFRNFRGHVGQAGENVKNFIRDFYPQEEFRNFLEAHPDVFIVFDDGTVSLIEHESVNYFRECLEKEEGRHFMNFRGHIGQANDYIIDYINSSYPGENFLQFLKDNPDTFIVDVTGCVFLNENEN